MTGGSTQQSLREVRREGRDLRVTFEDGHRALFHAIWLRDNAPGTRHPQTNQRLVETASLPEHPAVEAAEVADGDLAVTWADDGARHVFAATWLRAHAYEEADRAARRAVPQLWDATLDIPTVEFARAEVSEVRQAWLTAFSETGLVRMTGVPVERGRVAQVAESFGFVRETNYGRIFDVESTPDPNHLAYADVPLALHTDNPYRDPVPGLQLLHCLQAARQGGDTVLVDGFGLAHRLREEAPEEFAILSRVAVPFRFVDETCDLRSAKPLIACRADGEVDRIHFNDRSMAPLDVAPELVEPFYRAYRHLTALTRRPELQLRFRLEPGDLIIFDNERVLHARTGFDSRQGRRHLQGCYADRDALDSSRRMATRRLQAEPATTP